MGENEKKTSPEKKNGTENSVIRFSESDENDPCIDCRKQSMSIGKKSFWNEKENLMMEKTGLTRRGLRLALGLLLVVLLFFIIIVILASLWPRKPHHMQFAICKEPACLRAAAQIREALNSSVSPCDDLWFWACGRWLEKNSLPPDRSIWNQEAELALQEARRVRDLVNTLPSPIYMGTVKWKLKHLYECCLDVEDVNSQQARPLLNIISELGGWYILRDWSLEGFNYKEVLTNLHVKYGVSPYFKVSVQPNPWGPGKNIIVITPSGLGLPDKSYYYRDDDDSIKNAYKRFIRDIIINLSVTITNAEKFSTDIYGYEKRIAESTPDSFELENVVSSYSLIKLSDLHYTASMVPVQDILSALYPDANINGDTEVVVSSLNYLIEISRIISSTDRATRNGYMIWTLVREYLPYLSSEFTSSLTSYQRDLLGVKQAKPRWEECANLVYRFAGLAVEGFLEKDSHIKNKTLVVNQMVQSIRDAVQNHVERYKKVPHLYQHLLKKVSGLKIQIGIPNGVLGADHLKQYYSKLIVQKIGLFDNYRHGLEFLRKIEGQRLVLPQPEDVLIDGYLSKPLSVSYIPSVNTLIVPRAVLSKPFFDSEYPSSIRYSGLGVQISKAIISSVTPFEINWGSNLKLLSPSHNIVNETIKNSQEPRKCISKYLTENIIDDEVSATATSLSLLKELSAINFAYIGLFKSLEKEEHTHQPSLEEFEDDSLFFLTYSQTQCSVLTRQHDFLRRNVEFKLPQQLVLRVTASHYTPFLESLNCRSNQKKTHCDDIF